MLCNKIKSFICYFENKSSKCLPSISIQYNINLKINDNLTNFFVIIRIIKFFFIYYISRQYRRYIQTKDIGLALKNRFSITLNKNVPRTIKNTAWKNIFKNFELQKNVTCAKQIVTLKIVTTSDHNYFLIFYISCQETIKLYPFP